MKAYTPRCLRAHDIGAMSGSWRWLPEEIACQWTLSGCSLWCLTVQAKCAAGMYGARTHLAPAGVGRRAAKGALNNVGGQVADCAGCFLLGCCGPPVMAVPWGQAPSPCGSRFQRLLPRSAAAPSPSEAGRHAQGVAEGQWLAGQDARSYIHNDKRNGVQCHTVPQQRPCQPEFQQCSWSHCALAATLLYPHEALREGCSLVASYCRIE